MGQPISGAPYSGGEYLRDAKALRLTGIVLLLQVSCRVLGIGDADASANMRAKWLGF